ncbi:glycosyltransferase [Niallia alba]|uniref:glycosyltransferase n=1 Tax=Niallia alba TaxID=2729105 RepID=UPI00399F6FCB
MTNLVSIILPTFNTGNYIINMLDSIKTQEYSPIELVIIDDYSTDDTFNNIKHWKEINESDKLIIKLIRNEINIGLTASVNRGYEQCNGKYIFLSDHDDIWCPDKVKKQVLYLESNSERVICFHDREIIDSDNNTLCKSEYRYMGYKKTYVSEDDLIKKSFRYSANTLCFKNIKEGQEIFPIPDDIVEHDYYLAISFSLFGKVGVLNDVLVKYRIHENNLSGNYALETINSFKDYKNIIKKNFERNKVIIKLDQNIIENHIYEVFNKNINLSIQMNKRNYKKYLSEKIPYLHYLYIKKIVQKRFLLS